MKQRQAHESNVKKLRMNVLEKYCVDLRVGDIWQSGNETIKIIALSRKIDYANGSSVSQQDAEGSGYLPWPLVRYVGEEGEREFIGAPAFKFMSLVSQGSGELWQPAREMKKIQAEEKKQKEKEDAKRADGRTGYQGPKRYP